MKSKVKPAPVGYRAGLFGKTDGATFPNIKKVFIRGCRNVGGCLFEWRVPAERTFSGISQQFLEGISEGGGYPS